MKEKFEYHLKKSNYLTIFFCLIHLGTMISMMKLPIPILIIIFCMIMILVHLYYVLRYYAWRDLDNSVTSFWIDEKDRWGIKKKNGQQYIASISGDSIRTSFLFILRMKCRSHIENIIIPLDALSDHQYRKLSARLFTFS